MTEKCVVLLPSYSAGLPGRMPAAGVALSPMPARKRSAYFFEIRPAIGIFTASGSPMNTAHGCALHRAIIFQIVHRHDAAGAAHRGRNLHGDAALVERARAVLRDR